MSARNLELNAGIDVEEENEFKIQTTDFFRPDLKQIGKSVCDIKNHFVNPGRINVVPSTLPPQLEEIQDGFLKLLEDKRLCVFQGQNIATEELLDVVSDELGKSGLLLMSLSLPVLFNYEAKARPDVVICDIVLVIPLQPVVVFTVVEGDETSDDVQLYSTSVARGFTTRLIRYLSFDFKPVNGIINASDIKHISSFNQELRNAVKMSKVFVQAAAFSMDHVKFEKIQTAIWASIAETKSVLSSAYLDNYQHFLTKEQCIVLVEGINGQQVHVQALSKTGATTLMLEIARRLSKRAASLLICERNDDKYILRNHHQNTICKSELDTTDLTPYRYIVDETNSVHADEDTWVWSFHTAASSPDVETMDVSVTEKRVHSTYQQLHTPESGTEKMDVVTAEQGVTGASEKKRRLIPTSSESASMSSPLKKQETGQGKSGVSWISYTSEDGSLSFNCPRMDYHASRVNIKKSHLSSDKLLINKKWDNTGDAQGTTGLQKYWGTCSSDPIPLIPNLSPNSPYSRGPQYWETHTNVKLNKTLPILPVLEMGVCEESDVDGQFWVCRQSRSWCIRIDVCTKHHKRICTQVWGEGRNILCLPDPDVKEGTMPNQSDAEATVSYGIVLDAANGRMGFVDLDRKRVLQKFDVEFKEMIYPMFGVGSIQDKVEVKMRLVSGTDISMTEEKKSLVFEALSK